jgi:hypothetical protein
VRRQGKRRNGASDAPREYNPDEVEALTKRANELLDELHTVMGEMTDRLRVVFGEETP